MNCFVCFDGDHIGRQVGRAVLSDDVSEVRRVDQAIQHGNEIWKAFALRAGGNVIEIGGDEGRIQIAVDQLAEVPDITRQYEDAVGASVSVGIGMRLSESAKALMVAKLRGGRQVLLWTTDMEKEIKDAQGQSEQAKIVDEYLTKTVALRGVHTGHIVGDNPGTHGGFAGNKDPGRPTLDKPKQSQGDHEEGAVLQDAVQEARDAEVSPEGTHAADGLEDELHDHAQAQEKGDQDGEVRSDQHLDQLKAQLAEVLQTVRQQMPVLAQLRQASPDAFGAIMNLVQGVIALGREVTSQSQPPDDTDPSNVQQGLQTQQGQPQQPQQAQQPPGQGQVGPQAQGGPVGAGEGQAVQKAEEEGDGEEEVCEGCGEESGSNKGCKACIKKADEWAKSPETKGKVGKSGGPIDGGTFRNPVPGTEINGKIFTPHADGTKSWVEQRSGSIQGLEPDAPMNGANSHGVSTDSPGAR